MVDIIMFLVLLEECFEENATPFPPKLLQHAKSELEGPYREVWNKDLVLPHRFRKFFPGANLEDEKNVKGMCFLLIVCKQIISGPTRQFC